MLAKPDSGGGRAPAQKRIPGATAAGPGSDSANPSAVRFADTRLHQAQQAHLIPQQHLPTDALGLVSLYHALSPQIAHQVGQGATLGGAHPRPLPYPSPPQGAFAQGGGGGGYAPAQHSTTLPQRGAVPGPSIHLPTSTAGNDPGYGVTPPPGWTPPPGVAPVGVTPGQDGGLAALLAALGGARNRLTGPEY